MACGDNNDFIIPKGKDYDFTIQVLQDHSFLPQKLDAFSTGSFTLLDMATGETILNVPAITLSKLTEETVPAVALVMEETDIAMATSELGIYTITINGTTYTADMTNNGTAPTGIEVATAFQTAMAVLPENITVSRLNNVLTIKNTIGQVTDITYSTNLVRTRYIVGTEAVTEYTKTYYNDNGFLQGTIPASSTTNLAVSRGDAVDKYYLKPNYQGVLEVNFSDATPTKTAIICEIYVVPTGS